MRLVIYGVGSLYLALAAYIFAAPRGFYDSVPGVAMTGTFNSHFIRDAGLAFLASGAALLWGAVRRNHSVMVFGAAWPCLHAVFHAWMWIDREFPFDLVAAANLFGIQTPAWLALTAALSLKEKIS